MFHETILRQKIDDVIFYIAINFWYVFLGLAILFFLISIKLFKDKALLHHRLSRIVKALDELAKKKKLSEIESFIVEHRQLFHATSVALYVRRGDLFVLQVATEEGDFTHPNRLYKRDIIEYHKVGQYHQYMIESHDERALLVLVAKRAIPIEEYKGVATIILAYYVRAMEVSLEHNLSDISDASKEVFSSMMRFQHGTETFLKFVISLLFKVGDVAGIVLATKEHPDRLKVFGKPNQGSYKKRFFIRNTPYILDMYTKESLAPEQITEIGSFLDMAGAYFENADENSKMVANYINFLRLANRALELQSRYFKNHSKKVQIVAVEVAKNLFLDERSIDAVSLGAELHDIGMIGKIETLLDSDRIEKKELDLIRYHPIVGSVLVEPINHVYSIVPIIKYHHERFDGTGYPYGLKGKDIPILAQVVALAEYYVGITSARAYRKAKTHEEALDDIVLQRDGLVESQIVDAFMESAEGIKKKLAILDAE